jgi:AbrB-like transcriptional regulator
LENTINLTLSMKKSAPTPLTGKALLSKVKELSNLSRRETAKQCGYVITSKSGQERVNLADFYDAVLAAKGIEVTAKAEKDGRGREATYKLTVQQNGQLLIGAAYTRQMGLKQGDEFTLKLGYKHIRLESTSLAAEGK